jgi:hypothetical protein
MRKLKVFEAQIGFYDTVVAAPSRAAALRAWGTHQDLFASGQARVSNDVDAAAVAIENPEKPLRRALGSKEPYSLMPAELPTIPAVGNERQRPGKKTVGKPKPSVDRSALDAAENHLRDLVEAQSKEESYFKKEADALDQRRIAAQNKSCQLRKQASDRLDEERRAYRKAGGAS